MDEKKRVRELLFQSEQARKARLHPVWASLGLIAGQPRVLSKLLEKDGITQKALAEACGIDPATLSRALDRLEAMGLISRQGHPNSRRALLIELTKDGRIKAEEVRKTFDEIETRMLGGFTEEETKELLKTLERIYQNLKEG